MKKKIMVTFIVTTIAISFMACRKDFVKDKSIDKVSKVVKLDNVNFATVVSPNYIIPGDGFNYDEIACTTKVDTVWVAGTKCFESVGKTCTKATNCVPISTAAFSGKYTKEEINRKIELIEKAYGIRYTY